MYLIGVHEYLAPPSVLLHLLSRKRTNTLVREASLLLPAHHQHRNLRQNRPNQLPHLHLQHQQYYTKGRERGSERGQPKVVESKTPRGFWQSRHRARERYITTCDLVSVA